MSIKVPRLFDVDEREAYSGASALHLPDDQGRALDHGPDAVTVDLIFWCDIFLGEIHQSVVIFEQMEQGVPVIGSISALNETLNGVHIGAEDKGEMMRL